MKMFSVISMVTTLVVGFAAHAGDPNVTKEGPFSIVTSEACIKYGGHPIDDKTHFLCDGGKYDGFITGGTDIGSGGETSSIGQSQCESTAKQAVKALISLHIPADEMKSFEIRKVNLDAVAKNSNNQTQESLTVTYGYKQGELSWENYDVKLVVAKLSSDKCMVRSYQIAF